MSQPKTITRPFFKTSLPPGTTTDQILALAAKGKLPEAERVMVTFTPPEAKAGMADGAKTLTRAEFNAMPHRERGQFFKNGGKLTESPRQRNAFKVYQQQRATA